MRKFRVPLFLRAILVFLSLAGVAVLGGFVPLNAKWFYSAIHDRVLDATGFELQAVDSIVVRLGPAARIRIEQLVLATPAQSTAFELDEASLQLSLIDLLRGHVTIYKAAASGLRANRCVRIPAQLTSRDRAG